MKKTKLYTTLSLSTVILLSGCSSVVSPQPTIDSVNKTIKTPKRYTTSNSTAKVQNDWLKDFKDKKLISLVNIAQQNNPDLQLAASNVAQAASLLKLSESNLYPNLDFRGSYQFRNYTLAQKHDLGNFVFSVNWEADIWGKLSTAKQRDYEYMFSQEALYCYARESLAANTAKAWFLINSDKLIYNFNKKLIKIQKDARDIIAKRVEIGQGNKRDLHMIQGMLAQAQNDSVTALQTLQTDTRALEILLGKYPSNTLRTTHLPSLPHRVPNSIPLALLDQRADIIAAKYQVASAFHNVEVAKKLRLPSLSISLQGGYDVLQDSIAKAIGNIFMPIFDAGAVQSRIDSASADQQAAIAMYKSTVLRAYKEVEDALANERQLAQRYRYISTMTREFKQAYDMSEENYKIGQGSLLDVLQVQTQWINARIAKINIQKARLVNRVNLYLALGGHYSSKKPLHK